MCHFHHGSMASCGQRLFGLLADVVAHVLDGLQAPAQQLDGRLALGLQANVHLGLGRVRNAVADERNVGTAETVEQNRPKNSRHIRMLHGVMPNSDSSALVNALASDTRRAKDSHFFASTYRNELPSVWSSSVITNVAHVSSALASCGDGKHVRHGVFNECLKLFEPAEDATAGRQSGRQSNVECVFGPTYSTKLKTRRTIWIF
jgi:hypothetical protein